MMKNLLLYIYSDMPKNECMTMDEKSVLCSYEKFLRCNKIKNDWLWVFQQFNC